MHLGLGRPYAPRTVSLISEGKAPIPYGRSYSSGPFIRTDSDSPQYKQRGLTNAIRSQKTAGATQEPTTSLSLSLFLPLPLSLSLPLPPPLSGQGGVARSRRGGRAARTCSSLNTDIF